MSKVDALSLWQRSRLWTLLLLLEERHGDHPTPASPPSDNKYVIRRRFAMSSYAKSFIDKSYEALLDIAGAMEWGLDVYVDQERSDGSVPSAQRYLVVEVTCADAKCIPAITDLDNLKMPPELKIPWCDVEKSCIRAALRVMSAAFEELLRWHKSDQPEVASSKEDAVASESAARWTTYRERLLQIKVDHCSCCSSAPEWSSTTHNRLTFEDPSSTIWIHGRQILPDETMSSAMGRLFLLLLTLSHDFLQLMMSRVVHVGCPPEDSFYTHHALLLLACTISYQRRTSEVMLKYPLSTLEQMLIYHDTHTRQERPRESTPADTHFGFMDGAIMAFLPTRECVEVKGVEDAVCEAEGQNDAEEGSQAHDAFLQRCAQKSYFGSLCWALRQTL